MASLKVGWGKNELHQFGFRRFESACNGIAPVSIPSLPGRSNGRPGVHRLGIENSFRKPVSSPSAMALPLPRKGKRPTLISRPPSFCWIQSCRRSQSVARNKYNRRSCLHRADAHSVSRRYAPRRSRLHAWPYVRARAGQPDRQWRKYADACLAPLVDNIAGPSRP